MAKLTREETLRKHREMWTAMREKLGDNPWWESRDLFKEDWCREHGDEVLNNCYLCQYDEEHCGPKGDCRETCLVDWGEDGGCMSGEVTYMDSPISEILALPERKVNDAENS